MIGAFRRSHLTSVTSPISRSQHPHGNVTVDNIVVGRHIVNYSIRPLQKATRGEATYMKLSANTVLITGATSGIGLELALQLHALNNTVIVTGRDEVKLQKISREYPNLHTIQSDVSDPEAIATLCQTVVEQFPRLNILINNAGIMRKINLQDKGSDLKDIGLEIETNLMGPIRMVKQFLPLLNAQPSAAIVNVSSGLAFSPFPISPIYCATKAGIHSFTQSLRVQLKDSKIKVFELAPPATDTPLQGAFTAADLKGTPMMGLKKMVATAIRGLRRDQPEILPGLSKVLRAGSRIAPNTMVKAASGPVDAMLAETTV
jgi:uncharacterized oxidoreductase